LGRVAGNGASASGGFVFDLAKSSRDMAGGTERYQRIFGSYHTGITQFVFCDGSVRAIANTTDPVLLQRFAGRNDGATASDP
jgi:hypothetical protein